MGKKPSMGKQKGGKGSLNPNSGITTPISGTRSSAGQGQTGQANPFNGAVGKPVGVIK